jgi:hypothetical protein
MYYYCTYSTLLNQTKKYAYKACVQNTRRGWVTTRGGGSALWNIRYTQNDVNDLSEGALHLFATHQQKNAYNEEMLYGTVPEDNPLAVIKCKDEISSQQQFNVEKPE